MYAAFDGGGKVVDTPPAHLEEEEGDDEHPKGCPTVVVGQPFIMDVDEVGQPSDGSPGFFGVPRPVMSPGFLRPKSTEEHSESEE